MGAPWYLKSLWYKGTILSVNHDLIVGQGLGDPMNIAVRSPLAYALVNVPLRLLAAPWSFSLCPGQHQGDTFGPLLLAVLPFLLITGIPGRAKPVAFCLLTYWLGIILMEMTFVQGGSSIRYNSTVLLGAAPLVPHVLASSALHGGVRRFLSVGCFTFVVLGMALFWKRYNREWKALMTLASRDAYYGAVIPEYPVIRRINRISDGRKVMPAYNFSDYLIDVPYLTAYRHYGTVGEMKADLKARGVGYLFANNRLRPEENAGAFGDLDCKRIAAESNGFYLFEVTCP